MMGPTGIGVLWGRAELLEAMPPFLGGGGMILDVKLDGFRPAPPPARFEAGTPPIAEAVGLTAAIAYLGDIGMDRIRAHELALTNHALARLDEKLGSDVRVFGPPAGRRPGRRAVTGLPGRPRARPGPGARPVRGVRPTGPPLRQAADAAARRPGHCPRLVVPVQRRA